MSVARLVRGENEKIDLINDLVSLVKTGSSEDRKYAEGKLIEMFTPMILSVCKKWSMYFNDDKHVIKPWDNIVADASYWLIIYTRDKYIIDGSATYNTFIKNHIDQRVRYIYECELKYCTKVIFPDPDKHADSDSGDSLENVIYGYCSSISNDEVSMDDMLIDSESDNKVLEVYNTIMDKIDSDYFTDREKTIFKNCLIGDKTHQEIGAELGISRTRVSQIVGKLRKKICDMLDDNVKNWWEVK